MYEEPAVELLCEAGRIWLHHSFDFSSILDDIHQDMPTKDKNQGNTSK